MTKIIVIFIIIMQLHTAHSELVRFTAYLVIQAGRVGIGRHWLTAVKISTLAKD